MNFLDYLILFASVLAIALYGVLRTRGRRNMHDYLRGKRHSWLAIGLSVMATQASAIAFLSTPGQAYAGGMSFIQNYFALPLALVIIAAFFLPIYRKLNVYTAYEYLSSRFDKKTRLLAAGIFLLNRGIGAGITIYAPAIVLSTVFNWPITATIIGCSAVVTIYTVAGGSDAVTNTQKYQLAIIFGGMITAFIILMQKIPCSFTDALTLAGHFGKLNAVTFTPATGKTFFSDRYTFWSGMLGGLFLMLSYFGTDQSQVQRYISGDDLRESRLGLMFNALFKIPMQFGILLLGVMLFVFYLFNPAPIFFNRTALQDHLKSTVRYPSISTRNMMDRLPEGERLSIFSSNYQKGQYQRGELVNKWLDAHRNNKIDEEKALAASIDQLDEQSNYIRTLSVETIKSSDPKLNTNDSDYVFITFILDNLPHGLIGLLVACFFFAALNAKAAELNALASCTMVDIFLYLRYGGVEQPALPAKVSSPATQAGSPTLSYASTPPAVPEPPPLDERTKVRLSRFFTALWGLIALVFALFCHMAENLIQFTNIIASIFYPTLLSLFILGFFFKFISATPAFIGALASQILVIVIYVAVPESTVSYLWYNLIGVVATLTFAAMLQPIFPRRDTPQGFPVESQK